MTVARPIKPRPAVWPSRYTEDATSARYAPPSDASIPETEIAMYRVR